MIVNNLIKLETPANTISNSYEAMIAVDPPCVYPKYYKTEISIGESLEIPYIVGDRTLEELKTDKIALIYTVHLVIDNKVDYIQNVYTGKHIFTIPPFSEEGEHYFNMYAVDARGVDSPTLYLYFKVNSDNPLNTYIMLESDIETYNIHLGLTVDNKDWESDAYKLNQELAIENRINLVLFWNSIKTLGYDKVIMLPYVYVIDKHKTAGVGDALNSDGSISSKNDSTRSMNPPSNFIIDLNGATIADNTSHDLKGGTIFGISDRVSLHIINGNIKGSFETFDFAGTKTYEPNSIPGEGMSTIYIKGSRYVTFENCDISNSVGYDLCIGNASSLGSFGTVLPDTNFFYGYIDRNGLEIEMTNGIPLDKTDVNDPSLRGDNFIMITSKSYTTIKAGIKDFCVGVYLGYSGYRGSRKEVWVAFYDADKNFIKIQKTYQYWNIVPPENAVYVRGILYGTWVMHRFNSTYPLKYCYFGESVNTAYINCTIHDTRTCAPGPASCNNHAIIGCTFYDIAKEHTYGVTRLLADYEDGWQRCKNIYILNNKFLYGDEASFNIIYGTNVNLIGNSGINLRTHGGIVGGEFSENTSSRLYLRLNTKCNSNLLVFNNNIFKVRSNSSSKGFDTSTVDESFSITYNSKTSPTTKSPVDGSIVARNTIDTRLMQISQIGKFKLLNNNPL